MSPLASLIRPVIYKSYKSAGSIVLQAKTYQQINHKVVGVGVRCFSHKVDFINQTSWVGNTKLHEVAKSKLPIKEKETEAYKICHLLLEKGANPNIPDYSGKTPLDTAKANGDIKLCELLIKYGANTSSF